MIWECIPDVFLILMITIWYQSIDILTIYFFIMMLYICRIIIHISVKNISSFWSLFLNPIPAVGPPSVFEHNSKSICLRLFTFFDFSINKQFRLKVELFNLLPAACCLNALFYLNQTKLIIRPSSSHWILIFHSFLEILQQKKAQFLLRKLFYKECL